jgi:bifunctional non-homologous end joining protein LigD
MPKERCMLGYDAGLDDLHLQGTWRYQPKLDGARGVAEYNNGTIHIVSRTGEDWTDRLPEMVEALHKLAQATGADTFKIDGEIVVFKDGHTHMPSANSRIKTKDRQRIKLILRRTLPVTYMVFDVIQWNGTNYTGAAFTTRDALLNDIFRIQLPIAGLQKVPTYTDPDECWNDWVIKRKEEGVMLKRADSLYIFDRSRDWLKVKARDKATFKVVGYTQGNGNREELFGALIIANITTGAFVARCGGGFTHDTAREIIGILEHEPKTGLPFPESEVGRPYTAVDTKMVVDVAFQATDNYSVTGRLRSPQLIGYRMVAPPAGETGAERVEAVVRKL